MDNVSKSENIGTETPVESDNNLITDIKTVVPRVNEETCGDDNKIVDLETEYAKLVDVHETENICKDNENNSATTSAGQTSDPYFYTKRDGNFTSEIFKIELLNLPPRVGYGQLKTFFNKLELNPHKVKTVHKHNGNINFAFVTFRSEEDRDNALKILNDSEFRGVKLAAKKANPSADPLVKKRKEGASEDSDVKRHKGEDDVDDSKVPVSERVLNAVVPWHKTEYSAQVELKQKEMGRLLVKMGRQIEKINHGILDWLYKQRKENNFMCCKLLDVIPSPVTKRYRNKCEFNIGRHLETGEVAVGFRISSYKEGSKSVAEPDGCSNVPEVMIKVAKSFQKYIIQSGRDIYNPETYEGYWRQLTVRSNLNNDVMIVVVMHPQSLTTEELNLEKEKLKEYFENEDGKSCNVKSVFFHAFSKLRSNEVVDFEYVSGQEHITEKMSDLTFRISPSAFFQVNTLAAELLYQAVGDLAEVTSETTVLDLCCGTGTIGLTLAKKAKKVIGVELCRSAVLDAKANAELNGITNIEFVNSKVEESIYRVLHTLDNDSDVVAILDPPRAGLHNKVIKAIRGNTRIKRLLYVSCDPNLAMQNFKDLMRPVSNNYQGSCFLPVKAVPVDLFPDTPHCELVLLFERRKV